MPAYPGWEAQFYVFAGMQIQSKGHRAVGTNYMGKKKAFQIIQVKSGDGVESLEFWSWLPTSTRADLRLVILFLPCLS